MTPLTFFKGQSTEELCIYLPRKKAMEAAGKAFEAENQSTVCRQHKPVSKKGTFNLERRKEVMLEATK